MPYKLEPEQKKQPSISTDSLHRLPAQAAKGAGATFAGIVGDVLSLPYAGVNKVVKALGGQDVPYEQSLLGKTIPTTQTHIKNLEEGIPYLKPRNKVESFVNDIASDAVSLAIPGSGIGKVAKLPGLSQGGGVLGKVGLRGTGPWKSFFTSLGANSAGSFVTDLTGDPSKGAYTKMGAMFLFSSLNKPGAEKEVGKLYQKADELLPKNATVNARRLESDMIGLKNKILNGRTSQDLAASEKFVIDEADKILRQVDMGKSNVGTLRSAVRSLNENLTKMVYEAPDKGTKTRARSLAKQINHSINNTLSDYGKLNPEWWKAHKSATEGFATLSQSNFIKNFIENNVKSGTALHALSHALGAGVGTAGVVPYQTVKLTYRIANSPTLAKIYARVVSSAAAENAPLMRKELEKLDQELKKEHKKNPRYRIEH